MKPRKISASAKSKRKVQSDGFYKPSKREREQEAAATKFFAGLNQVLREKEQSTFQKLD